MNADCIRPAGYAATAAEFLDEAATDGDGRDLAARRSLRCGASAGQCWLSASSSPAPPTRRPTAPPTWPGSPTPLTA